MTDERLADQFSFEKLADWLGPGWLPSFTSPPSQGFHCTRKGWAESILAEGFKPQDRKRDGSSKNRRLGPAVYFFVEGVPSKVSGKDAALLYGTRWRGWGDPAVLCSQLCLGAVVDLDSWPQWQKLIRHVEEELELQLERQKRSSGAGSDGTMEELGLAREMPLRIAANLLRDAVGVDALLRWSPDLPGGDVCGYQTLAVLFPVEGKIGATECVNLYI